MPDWDRLAALHATAFDGPLRWSAAALRDMAGAPGGFVLEAGDATGFALGRAILDEAELLALVVAADTRRRGTGRALLARFEAAARARGAARAFLEVAAGNAAARALYARAGWRQVARRPDYSGGADALVLRVDLAPA